MPVVLEQTMGRDYLLATARGDRVVLLGFSAQGSASYLVALDLAGTEKGTRFVKARIEDDAGERWLDRRQLRELLLGARGILHSELGALVQPFAEALAAWGLEARPVDSCRICLLGGRARLRDDSFVRWRGEHRSAGKEKMKSRRERQGASDAMDGATPEMPMARRPDGAGRGNGEFICPRCAAEELHRELEHRGIRSPQSRKRAAQRLARTRDLDLALDELEPDGIGNATRVDVLSPARVKPPAASWDDVDLPPQLRQAILKDAPQPMAVQSLAIGAGLLERQSLLVVSATATGKTLVGELAGVKAALEGRGKMLYLAPLVALANQKYDDLRHRYSPLGLSVALRVGASRVRRGRREHRASVDSDFVVGTYEGVDHLLRTGGAPRMGDVATVVVDEVHLLADAERGHRLDGVVARLRFAFPDAQFIYLSATVGGPVELAEALGARLVEYEHRPVPIERHLVLVPHPRKPALLTELVSDERGRRSSRGRAGQVMIFTDSRRNCASLADALTPRVAAYHAGLPYHRRREVERAFLDGRLDAVVSTAALAAGVDFPASMVVFESLRMGAEWLTPAEFHQMQGRAGRPSYHDLGRVVVLADPQHRPDGAHSEEQVAHRLLSSGLEPLEVRYDSASQAEEVMACLTLTKDRDALVRCACGLLGLEEDVETVLSRLEAMGLIDGGEKRLRLTPLGDVAVRHFIQPETAVRLAELVDAGRHPLDIMAELAPFDDLHSRLADRVSASLGYPVPSRIWSGGFLDLLSDGERLHELEPHVQEKLLDFAARFMRCECEGAPHCPCAQREFTRELLDLWVELRDVDAMLRRLDKDWFAYSYEGDLTDYLDAALRMAEAVREVAGHKGMTRTCQQVEAILG